MGSHVTTPLFSVKSQAEDFFQRGGHMDKSFEKSGGDFWGYTEKGHCRAHWYIQ